MHFKVDSHMHISLRTVVKFTSQKSNPLSVLPVFKHQNQNVDIPIIVFFISFLFVTFETTIIKENLLKNSFKSHKILTAKRDFVNQS